VNGVAGAERIAVGQEHACAILDTNAVKCWGRNHQGQLGNGTETDSSTPVTVTFGAAVDPIDIDTGRDNTCVVLADGTARCWGNGSDGILGDGSNADSSIPLTVSGITDATQIATALQSTCARLGDGTLWCWGIKVRLGNGETMGVQSTPVAVAGLTGVASVTAGTAVNCVAFDAGGAKCWGQNTYGETGNGTEVTPQLLPVPVLEITDEIVEISAGDGLYGLTTCAVLIDTTTYCWGLNGNNQLGVPRTLSESAVPVGVGTFPEG
jgi:alpha-tubulin suppressor-like RCC1 family protein